MKPEIETINYKKLVELQLKNKLHLFLTGLTVILLVFVSVLAFLPKKIFTSRKKVESKPVAKEKKIFPKTYVTKEGDFLWQIAENNYGSGLNAYDIAKENNLTDPNSIPPGTKLTLPAVTPKTPTKGDISSIQSGQVTFQQEKYSVQLGDSLSMIAYRVYGDYNAWPTIAKTNNLSNPEAIEVGMILTIPR
jgi:nucleoid-associated protein YgaU